MTEVQSREADKALKLLDGGDSYAELQAYRFMLNFVNNTDPKRPSAYNFCHAMETAMSDIAGFPAKAKTKKSSKTTEVKEIYYVGQKVPQHNKVIPEDWATLKSYLEGQIRELEADPDLVQMPAELENLIALSEHLGLSEVDRNVLTFVYSLESSGFLAGIVSDLCAKPESLGAAIATMCNDAANYARYSQAVSPEGKFIKFGLMYKQDDNIFPAFFPDMMAKFNTPDLAREDIVKLMVGQPAHSELDYEDFAYLGKDLDMIADILKTAVETGERGVNILVYGPAGGGKTELSRTIAKKIGLPVFSIGEAEGSGQDKKVADVDEDIGYQGSFVEKDNSSTGKRRLGELLRAQTLLGDGHSCVLHFDEIEDLLLKGTDASKASDTESKIEINRLLENNAVPVIWNGNDPEKFHQAVRDRFTFSLYIDHPPVVVRRRIWERQSKQQGVELKPTELDMLARKYDAMPRKIALAIKAAKLSGGGLDAIEVALPAAAKVTAGSRMAILDHQTVSGNYDPAFSNIKEDVLGASPLPAIIGKGKDRLPFSLLIKGEKGAGLRSVARHISEEIALNPYEASMEVLATPTQQSTPEMNLFSAFATAADTGRFLCIHDIEHLSPAPNSMSGWDNNTLLKTFLEIARNHPLPFAVTTSQDIRNFDKALCVAFSERLTLQTMTEDLSARAFEKFFARPTPSHFDEIKGLVVADFAEVQKMLKRQRPQDIGEDQIMDMLLQQKSIRVGAEKVPMGLIPHRS